MYHRWPKKNSYTDDRKTDPKIQNLSCVNTAFLIKVMCTGLIGSTQMLKSLKFDFDTLRITFDVVDFDLGPVV
jgi:hypothetical protein